MYPFHSTYNLLTFLLITFSIINFSLICFQFFFVKYSNNFFTVKIINNMCPQHNIFNFFNLKTSSDQFGVQTISKIFLYFDILTISPISNLGFLLLISLLDSIYVLGFTPTGVILTVLWYIFINYTI